ncbi:MAG: hypothetical protein ACR2N0_01665 [Rubrobacteraceae bacterium]
MFPANGARKAQEAQDAGPPVENAVLQEDVREDGSPGTPATEGEDDAQKGRLMLEEANERALTQQIDEDVEDIMEACPYCGSASSAWTRRPPDEATS